MTVVDLKRSVKLTHKMSEEQESATFADCSEHEEHLCSGELDPNDPAVLEEFTTVQSSRKSKAAQAQKQQTRRGPRVPVSSGVGAVGQLQEMLEYIVLDAGAIIKGYGMMDLPRRANQIVTVPDVLSEVRDSKARDLLATLPFEIVEMNPSPQSLSVGESIVLFVGSDLTLF